MSSVQSTATPEKFDTGFFRPFLGFGISRCPMPTSDIPLSPVLNSNKGKAGGGLFVFAFAFVSWLLLLSRSCTLREFLALEDKRIKTDAAAA